MKIKYINFNWCQTEKGPAYEQYSVGDLSQYGTVESIKEKYKKNKLVYVVSFSTNMERHIFNPNEIIKAGKPIVEKVAEGFIEQCDSCGAIKQQGIETECEQFICNKCLDKYEVL